MSIGLGNLSIEPVLILVELVVEHCSCPLVQSCEPHSIFKI